MYHLITALLFAVTPVDMSDAVSDKESFPIGKRECYAYLSLSDVPDEDIPVLEAVAKVVVCSLSSERHVPTHLPYRVPGTNLLRIDLDALGWSRVWSAEIIQNYPYEKALTRYGQTPLVISGLWFVTMVTDQEETGDMQLQLLYQGNPPRNLAEAYAFWKVNTKELAWGFAEGKSGVSVAGRRTMAAFPTARRGGDAFSTYDFRKLSRVTNPVDNWVPFTHGFDAQEHLFPIIKTFKDESGILIAFLLTNNQGAIQAKAPVDIVDDNMQTRGREIRNYISCIACHPDGFVMPTKDLFAQYFSSGALAYAYDKKVQRQIDEFYESDIKGSIKESQKLYNKGVEMVSGGLTAQQFTDHYVRFVKFYDQDVTLEQTARELAFVTPKEVNLALAYQSVIGKNIGGELSQHAEGVPMPRDLFEQEAEWIQHYHYVWKQSLKK